jgi:ribosomal protein S17E
MNTYEIPDPFITFRAKKYAAQKFGYRYDFFSGEWDFNCGCCKELLNAPSKKILTKIRLYHTRNECTGGY